MSTRVPFVPISQFDRHLTVTRQRRAERASWAVVIHIRTCWLFHCIGGFSTTLASDSVCAYHDRNSSVMCATRRTPQQPAGGTSLRYDSKMASPSSQRRDHGAGHSMLGHHRILHESSLSTENGSTYSGASLMMSRTVSHYCRATSRRP